MCRCKERPVQRSRGRVDACRRLYVSRVEYDVCRISLAHVSERKEKDVGKNLDMGVMKMGDRSKLGV